MTQSLGDDTLELRLAHHVEQRLAVLERRDEPDMPLLPLERFEKGASPDPRAGWS